MRLPESKEATLNASPAAATTNPDSLHLPFTHTTPTSQCSSYRRTLRCSFARSLVDSSIVSLRESHLTVATVQAGNWSADWGRNGVGARLCRAQRVLECG
jgi:hypothetical protein